MLDQLYSLSQHFLKINYREYERYFLNRDPFQSRFSILIGQRGVGKTTAITQFLLSYSKKDFFSKKILYVQADHFLVRQKSLYEIAEEFSLNGGEIICFDEIHKYSNWSQELKSIYDTFPKLKIIASGSSILEIKKGSHDLSRRAIIYKLFGMSFREFLELTLDIKLKECKLTDLLKSHQRIASKIIETVEAKGKKIIPLFNSYLKYGYYPFFLEHKDHALYYIALEQNIHTTIENDLISVYPSLSGNSIKKISKLLSILAKQVPYTPDMRKLKTILELGDERTLKLYLKYLEDAGIVHLLSKKGSGLRQLEKPEKIYLNNPNLIYAISPASEVNVGSLRETFFINTLSAQHTVDYTSNGDFEIDKKFIFEVGGKNKDFTQIKNLKNSYLAVDNIEIGVGSKIPLYLFGFLY